MNRIAIGIVVLVASSVTYAQIDVGSDGSDGALNVTSSDLVIDLSQAVTAVWNTPSPQPGKGVYDADKWATVFKYSSVNIAANRTVTFLNHPSRAPVVWLIQGSATIAGTVSLDGADGGTDPTVFAEPGPGGFRGGRCASGTSGLNYALSAGFGPGGGGATGGGGIGGGGFGTIGTGNPGAAGKTYGNPELLPLIGGSGGSGLPGNCIDGGAGGGAILIAANGTISFINNSEIHSNGGWGNRQNYAAGGGSGGGIRLLADTVSGTVILNAPPGYGAYPGGHGRIRVEGNSLQNLIATSTPQLTMGTPNPVWPPANTPQVQATMIAGHPIASDPRGNLIFPNTDVTFSNANPLTLQIEASNVPLTWSMQARVVQKSGPEIIGAATFQSGTEAASIWTASLTLPNGISAIQVRAAAP